MSAAQRWRWLLGTEPGPAGSTEEHLEAAVNLVPDVVAAAIGSSITELDGGTYSTSASSSPLALELDLAQYQDGDGPCMTAARDRQVQLVRDMAAATRFTGFTEAAQRLGVRSSLSVPIIGPYHPAALNIYASTVDAFTGRDRVVAEFLGRTLTRRLHGSAGERPMSASEVERVDRRRRVMRNALERAAAPGTTCAQVFAELAARSVQERRSIYDIAGELVDTEGRS